MLQKFDVQKFQEFLVLESFILCFISWLPNICIYKQHIYGRQIHGWIDSTFFKVFISLKYKFHENRVFVLFTAISLLAKDLEPCSSIGFIMETAGTVFNIRLYLVSYLYNSEHDRKSRVLPNVSPKSQTYEKNEKSRE